MDFLSFTLFTIGYTIGEITFDYIKNLLCNNQ